MEREEYIGDGCYASFDGWHFILRAPREDGDHFIYLEPKVLSAFIEYTTRVQDLLAQQERGND